jgi:hypothetical protein
VDTPLLLYDYTRIIKVFTPSLVNDYPKNNNIYTALLSSNYPKIINFRILLYIFQVYPITIKSDTSYITTLILFYFQCGTALLLFDYAKIINLETPYLFK